MRFDVITIFPEFVETVTRFGVTGRAVDQQRLQVKAWDLREFADNSHRNVDDRPYGGGPGMVMTTEPLARAVMAIKAQTDIAPKVVLLSPQGQRLHQDSVKSLAAGGDIILIAGRYEGIDERFVEQMVDEEWSIGDYVLSGGELAAMVVIDAVARMLPGVLGDAESAEQDSFMQGLLDCPHYTRPEVWREQAVPAVLLSGDHKEIAAWRRKQALGRTWERRPDLLAAVKLNKEDKASLQNYQKSRILNKSNSEF